VENAAARMLVPQFVVLKRARSQGSRWLTQGREWVTRRAEDTGRRLRASISLHVASENDWPMAALQTSKDYFREILEPNRSDFLSDRTSLRLMANYAISLHHLADWLGESDLSFVQSQWGNSISKENIWKYAESQVVRVGN
jgi:hypothetical protein